MLLKDITEEISTLTRFEKILLIEKISKMLLEEENPANYFDSQKHYPVLTPVDQEKAAHQLQQFFEVESKQS